MNPFRCSLVLIILQTFSVESQTLPQQSAAPKHEVRAVWITTVKGLDWPKSYDVSEQKQSLREMIQKLNEAHFNTIFFQVRGRGDAMYRSKYEPWSEQLTGRLGSDPGWDPLEFILTEAHSLGMEVHAWFNTYLIKSGLSRIIESKPRHLLLQHPDWVRTVNDEWWLDPGIPAVREYLIKVAVDLVRQYDIDGIQFDFIRYPLGNFPDQATYRRYGKRLKKDDWRRENINMFVRAFYDSAISIKPMLKIGSTPVGIYTNMTNVDGQEGYSELYQDSRRWLREGKHDYLAPQVYWSLGNSRTNPDFKVVTEDWSRYGHGRHLYIGLGAYKPEVHDQLPELIDLSRSAGVHGNAFFRYSNIAHALTLGERYRYRAIIPPMAWKDSIPPNEPGNLLVENISEGNFQLTWIPPSTAKDGDTAKYFNIYRSTTKPVNIDDPANLISIVSGTATSFIDTIGYPSAVKYYYAVSAMDKGYNESIPAEQVVIVPELAELSRHFAPEFKLGQCYPNPVSDFVFIPYEVGQKSQVIVTVLDKNDREVMTVVNAVHEPGTYVASAMIHQLRDGWYSCLMMAGEFMERKVFKVDH
ncbi:MAG: family 10 glycosylhydrolase [Ignavibacteriae bacterium]|nr:family 10 glycosylhydrolase [Ignavibacteriota bacterium]